MALFSKIDHYFFEVPVYRLSKNAHSRQIESEKRQYDEFRKQASPEIYAVLIHHLQTKVWPSWQYDEIVGWIRLFVVGSHIQAEYWWSAAKKQVKSGRKRYRWCGKAFELDLRRVKQSREILRLLLRKFDSLQAERPFKGRHIDLTLLKNIGPYVNWQSLVRD